MHEIFSFCLPDTNLIILWLEVVICTCRVIIEWFDAAIPSWTLQIMTWHVTRDRYVMISLVSPQWYWRQPRGGFSRESHLICVTRILHFLQSVSFIAIVGAVYGHSPVIAGACGHGREGGGRGTGDRKYYSDIFTRIKTNQGETNLSAPASR